MKKSTFYILSFTWGLPMTLIGLMAYAVLSVFCDKPAWKYGCCYYFVIGKNRWGGLNFGPVSLIQRDASDYLKQHEHGHAIQNCYFGPLMPFVVVFPSIVRYWYREIREKINKPCKTTYYDIWFEGQASKLGIKCVNQWGDHQ